MYEYRCEPTRVIDGDSVVCDIDLGFDVWLRMRHLRLAGIDCCEMRGGTKQSKALAQMAKDFVREKLLVFNGLRDEAREGIYIISREDGRGKFGRILADLYSPDSEVSINDQLVQNRMAVRYEGRSKNEVQDLHQADIIYHIKNGNITE